MEGRKKKERINESKKEEKRKATREGRKRKIKNQRKKIKKRKEKQHRSVVAIQPKIKNDNYSNNNKNNDCQTFVRLALDACCSVSLLNYGHSIASFTIPADAVQEQISLYHRRT